MVSRRQTANRLKTRRTTLTLPSESLSEAQRIARKRNVNLSTVISEALNEGLRVQATAERAREVLNNYEKAFSGFSDEEIAILDGIVLDEPAGDAR